ncbi:hypothetical protein [Myxococcus stipitatus]|uniref:hypothetical protein n=1 Tax=Myxococcus stipitatus TaxID=83455 RepID=UPI0030D48790
MERSDVDHPRRIQHLCFGFIRTVPNGRGLARRLRRMAPDTSLTWSPEVMRTEWGRTPLGMCPGLHVSGFNERKGSDRGLT